jgi:DNA-binding cell septation regulator SpoVG
MQRTKYEHQNLADANQEAALLWESICDESRIDRFHRKIVPHAQSVLFGYADVTLVVKTATGVKFPIKLRGIVVKSLKGKAHIDMPSEKGADGEFYDHFMPRSAALRTVLTTLIFADQEVQATLAEAANTPAQAPVSQPEPQVDAPAIRSGNPFARNAA